MFDISFGGKVTRVYDGDTIEVELKRTIKIRLLDLWCPEIRTRDADEKRRGLLARDFLKGKIEGKSVKVTVPIDGAGKFGDSMTFGRVLGHVTTEDGADVSEMMRLYGHGTAEKSG